MLAEPAPPFPASVEVTALVVLFFVPVVVSVTFTAKLQEALAAKLAPARVMLLDAAAAVSVPPPQLPVRPFGAATTCPAGRASVKPIPLREALAFGFARLNVSDVMPFSGTLLAP